MTSKKRMAGLAKQIARDVHENHFPSRRGVGPTDTGVYVYNNNPYSDPQWRREEHQRFAAWCEANRINIVADETYGEYVEDEGYTRVLILDAAPSRLSEVGAAYGDCIKRDFSSNVASEHARQSSDDTKLSAAFRRAGQLSQSGELRRPVKRKAATYVRSIGTGATSAQAERLRAYASERGFEVVSEYIDDGMSGVERARMLDDLQSPASDVDVVLVTSVNRLARSEHDAIALALILGFIHVELVALNP